jgi:hypothetical protein
MSAKAGRTPLGVPCAKCPSLFDCHAIWTFASRVVLLEHRTPKGVRASLASAIYKHATPPE